MIGTEDSPAATDVAGSGVPEALAGLLAFARRQALPVPEPVLDRQAAFGRERRTVLFGPVGSRLDELLRRLDDPDGGELLAGTRLSAVLLGGATGDEAAPDPETCAERADLVAVVSPAPAFLGQLETRRIESFHRQGRPFFLVITRLEDDPDERAAYREEIERFKLAPLRARTGPFEVFEADGDLRGRVAAWVERHRDAEHLRQTDRVVSGWTAGMAEALAQRAAAEARTAADLDFIAGHLDDQVGRLRDLVSQERMAETNRLRAALDDLLQACRDAAPSREGLDHVREAWEALAERVRAARSTFAQRLGRSLARQMREFHDVYRAELAPWELEAWSPPPAAEPAADEDAGYAVARGRIEAQGERPGALVAEARSAAGPAVDRAVAGVEAEAARLFRPEAEGGDPIARFAAGTAARIVARRAELTAAAAREELERLRGAWRQEAGEGRAGGGR